MAKEAKNSKVGLKLVIGHLERISSHVFSDFPRELTTLVGRDHGVYALYKKDRLYYVGLAHDLRNRIKNHLHDRHRGKWNTFSLYLVRRVDHLSELESLILLIADPTGNAKSGHLSHAHDLRPELNGRIREAQERQRDKILGGGQSNPVPKARRVHRLAKDDVPLSPYTTKRFKIKATYKGKDYAGLVRADGTISLGSSVYSSPSGAGKSVTGRATDGWRFWRCKDRDGNWVTLAHLRKGVTGPTGNGG